MSQLRLHYAAISDVGRVRKENQDSGYAGPWVLTVCDGVGGAVRGDLASSTAVSQLRKIDKPADDLIGQVGGAIHRADDRIAEMVEDDPELNGTSTTVTVVGFNGSTYGVGHLGDSRAYLLRDGELRQLTHDHTFVQTLIDEGRITEEQARTHPHRNLILKALDGLRHEEPDLFEVSAQAGDRLMVCSDGACGVLDASRIASILGTGTPEYAAVELVRDSLEAGSTDNVTVVVADVLDTDPPEELSPLVVGAAAEMPRPPQRGTGTAKRRYNIPADLPDDLPADMHPIAADPIDPEAARYAPQPPQRYAWLQRGLLTAVFLGVAWVAGAAAWSWSQQQFFVGEQDGRMT
ncbi:MAG: PP2C family protein-serine/threonine phosphatase, partial [Nocardioides sp.]|uniref:PP2C family protein-serine/threonine phosphatase n=1 Tax=Nocardioides sp. TaxID=35761 RepID=UPI003F07DC5A